MATLLLLPDVPFLSPGGGRGGEWGPADGVAADGVGVGDLLLLPAAGGVHVAQHRDGPVARAADQDEAELVRRPADRVDRGVVVAVLVELGPAARGVLAPQDDLKDSMASHTSGNTARNVCLGQFKAQINSEKKVNLIDQD